MEQNEDASQVAHMVKIRDLLGWISVELEDDDDDEEEEEKKEEKVEEGKEGNVVQQQPSCDTSAAVQYGAAVIDASTQTQVDTVSSEVCAVVQCDAATQVDNSCLADNAGLLVALVRG